MSKLQLVAGYGPYRVDKDGVPLLNDVVRDFLGKRTISAEDFGKRFGRLTRQQPYTKGRISQMLKDNSFSDEKPRRWVIAKLLQIPPVLMGVETLDELLVPIKPQAKPKTPLIQTYPTIPQEFDITEYRHSLKNYWLINDTNTASGVLGEINQRIGHLEQESLYGGYKTKENVQLIQLLCGYHMVFSQVARNYEYYDTAVIHLNKGYQLAKSYLLADTQAAILCRRGSVFDEQARGYENRLDFAVARHYFSWAKNDFLAAQELKQKLYAGLRGYTHIGLSLASSHLASTPYELHQAIVEMQKAEAFVGKDEDKNDVYFVKLDEERYHLDLASIYLNAPVAVAWYPKDARRELRNAFATRKNNTSKRRQAFETILVTKSYLLEKEYEEATKKTFEALIQVKEINVKVYLDLIGTFCNKLVATDYGKNSVDVAELEVTVMAMQHPEFFQ